MSSNNEKLHVIIVGGGIAGLAAARFIREHHNVTVYERAGPDAATGGHGISLFPNSVKLLNTIGFDRDRAGAVSCSGFRSYTKGGELKADMEVDFVDRYGSNSLTLKRSDFRDELFRLATAPAEELGVALNPVKTVFYNGAVQVDPQTGEVTLSDGTKDVGDVVVGKCHDKESSIRSIILT
jgi:salicylate hydroxylase